MRSIRSCSISRLNTSRRRQFIFPSTFFLLVFSVSFLFSSLILLSPRSRTLSFGISSEVRYTVYYYVCSRLCLRAFFSAVLMSFFFGERVILIEIENVIGHICFTRTMYHGSSIVYLSDNKIYCKI